MKDYYAILELTPEASLEDVKEQYHFMMQAWHPDKFINPVQKAKAEEKSKEINEAYAILVNLVKHLDAERIAQEQELEIQHREEERRRKRNADAERIERNRHDDEARRREADRVVREQAEAWKNKQEAEANRRSESVVLAARIAVLRQNTTAAMAAADWMKAYRLLEAWLKLVPSDTEAVVAKREVTSRLTAERGKRSRMTRRALLIGAFGVAAVSGLVALTSRQDSTPTLAFTAPYGEKVLTLALGVKIVFVRVPAGVFLMGNSNLDVDADSDEKPQSKLYLDEYWISKYDVTNAQYAVFAQATYRSFISPFGKDNHPVVQVSWDDAIALTHWVTQFTGRMIALPSEAQWEKAARGTDGRIYPWGNDVPNSSRLNFNGNIMDTTQVGKYSPQSDSPYGVADMAGNVWQWTNSLFKPYPYSANDGREDMESRDPRVVRGGGFSEKRGIRSALRNRISPFNRFGDIGFRVLAPAM